ncbi:rCG59348 [Rattus norvegicus]|uniref:RCG59348 n=1 Tax=Rattus norvegicus TaxID=10116 RepID=A6K7P4_RAT|nr:rCG59348 [Rattus norvegicus]
MGNQQHCDKATAVNILYMDIKALRKFNKTRRGSRRWPRNLMSFYPWSLISQIPMNSGPRPETN